MPAIKIGRISNKNIRKKNLETTRKKFDFLPAGLVLGILILAVVSGFYLWHPAQKRVRFCFDDSNNAEIENLQVSWILPDESEKILPVKDNCVELTTGFDEIQLRITSPYYVDKLIKRKIPSTDYTEQIDLRPDLIALLLQHYSQSDTNDWQKRRERLQKFIADTAMIFQQLPQKEGIELFDKQDFIDQLCIPTGWLKNMEILEITYQNAKVVKLRFRIKTNR